ncbi:MAG: cell division protein ZapA [Balneolaceae bacterium]
MVSIKVTILGKQFPLKVKDDEVENMRRIAEFVDEKFRLYRRELTNQPESTIMVLASLSIAEEMFSLRQQANEASVDEEELFGEVNERLQELISEIG